MPGRRSRGGFPRWFDRPCVPIVVLVRFGNALSQRIRSQPEFLDPLSGVDLAGIEVAPGVDRHGMHPVKLPGIAAIVAETADHGAVLAPDHPDLVVLAVDA